MARDSFGLERFVDAQHGAYPGVLRELRAGHKSNHWIWFIFPQIAGLGLSDMSRTYAIGSLEEARSYLVHPILGPRLRECATTLLAVPDRSAADILGRVDAMKLRSSMSLFLRAAPDEVVFQRVLDRFFDGLADPATDARLAM